MDEGREEGEAVHHHHHHHHHLPHLSYTQAHLNPLTHSLTHPHTLPLIHTRSPTLSHPRTYFINLSPLTHPCYVSLYAWIDLFISPGQQPGVTRQRPAPPTLSSPTHTHTRSPTLAMFPCIPGLIDSLMSPGQQPGVTRRRPSHPALSGPLERS